MSTIEFDQVLIRNTDYLKPFAMSLTKDRESAKDLLQETLYRALANKGKYNAGTNIKAWMFIIMRNIFINNYRRSAKQNTVFVSTTDDYQLDYNQFVTTNTPETSLSVKDILKAVHYLPEIFRNPFQLYFEGYKYHEIANILAEPLGTVKSRIHFARKLLKQQLKRY